MSIKQIALLASIVALSVVLSACHWHAVVGHDQSRGTYVEVGVEGSLALNSAQNIASVGLNSINPDDLYIEISSSNTTLITSTGEFTLKLSNADGELIAAQQFPYHRSGNRLVPDNPTAVSTWANGYPNATAADMSVDQLMFQDGQSGTASMEADVNFQGQDVASASQSWTAHGGINGSCGNEVSCFPQ